MSKHKIQVMLDAASARALDDIMKSTGENIVSAVYHSIYVYDWCRKQMADGWTIVAIKSETGVQKELLLPFPKKE